MYSFKTKNQLKAVILSQLYGDYLEDKIKA